jgi:hypothetical protein
MNLPAPTGSPIIARIQNNGKLPVILGAAAAFVLLLVVIGEIIRRMRALYVRASTSERQKTRPTTKKDIASVVKEYSFTDDESRLLYEICKKHSIPNVRFFLRDHDQTTHMFRTAYQASAGDNDAGHEQTLIFAMYEKICKSNMAFSLLTSTMSLRVGQKMLYIDPDGKKSKTFIVDSNENEMIIATPKDKAGNDIMLQSMTKINLMIQGKNEVAYSCAVRVIRNQITTGEPVVVVSHSNRFETFLKHEYVYVPAKIPCQLQEVETVPDPKRGPDAVLYDARGRTYNGLVLNYSGTSCNIVVKNSIRVRQILRLETKLDGRDMDQMIVLVMNVVENQESRAFLLHTNFVKLTEKTKNYILSHVYSFAENKGNTD